MNKAKSVEGALAAAEIWGKRGEPTWACRNYESAVVGYLSMAVSLYPDRHSGTNFLAKEGVPQLVTKVLGLYEEILSNIRAGKIPASVIGGNYGSSVLCHISWLLALWEEARAFVSISYTPEIRALGTPFWREYAGALQRLLDREEYTPPSGLRLRGLEVHWFAYLELISAITKGLDYTAVIAEARERFRKRNSDKRIRDDHFEIEGSGRAPVRWDFRLESILQAGSQLGY
jgi:hypothetical protein